MEYSALNQAIAFINLKEKVDKIMAMKPLNENAEKKHPLFTQGRNYALNLIKAHLKELSC